MSSGRTFHHPFEPYDIQIELMEHIYRVLDEGKKIGIFESPTGTGKTLSLICPTVTWLRENKAKFISEGNQSKEGSGSHVSDSDDEPEWVKEAYENSVLKESIQALTDYEHHLDAVDSSKGTTVLSHTVEPTFKRSRKLRHVPVTFEEADYLPGEYDENTDRMVYGDEKEKEKKNMNTEIKALLDKLHGSEASSNERTADLPSPIKIFFASRTHSQLTQFASQLTLPQFPSSFVEMPHERIKFLPMGSRKQLCIHPKVSNVGNQAINDFCLDTIKKNDCLPYSRYKEGDISRKFRDFTFSGVHDIEDLVSIGKSMNVCPYYASRDVVRSGVEVVTLPYQHLLVESTRQALGIDLKGAIVIIDEAHNVIDTINAVNSADLSLFELQDCKVGLQTYINKFKKRLNAVSRVNLTRLLKLIDVLILFIEKKYKSGAQFDSNDIFEGTNADMLNIYQLERYMKTSKIAFKVDSYTQAAQTAQSCDEKQEYRKQPVLFKIGSFLKTLANPSLEGQFFFEKGRKMKYMLLEPSHSFKSIVEDAKCVILAGGTMQPVEDFLTNLIPFVEPDQICMFSCNHVVPDENLNTFIVKDSFEFTFDKRENKELVKNLFDFLYKLSGVVPGGIVVFFSSHKYLAFVVTVWNDNGLLEKLGRQKKVYYESAKNADVLSEYTKEVHNSDKGAFLFAVVGGRLSEGINFQDELARAVVMVGLPFPNLFSGELIIKRKHLEQKILKRGGSPLEAKKSTRDFYENICMKAVNQSIGRAIRHINDYANIYLVDKRYGSPEIQTKLSQWVKRRIQPQNSINDILKRTATFFSNKQSRDNDQP